MGAFSRERERVNGCVRKSEREWVCEKEREGEGERDEGVYLRKGESGERMIREMWGDGFCKVVKERNIFRYGGTLSKKEFSKLNLFEYS